MIRQATQQDINVYTKEDYRNQGIQKELMCECIFVLQYQF